MKAVLLAGGSGSRLWPLTQVASKQLLPVYDKPLVWFPLATLLAGGFREVLLIATPRDLPRFRELLGDGTQWGLTLSYLPQERPAGVAQALVLARDFAAGGPLALILGDNIFVGDLPLDRWRREFAGGALACACSVQHPERYGVVELGPDGEVLALSEKPTEPRSQFAVPGLYLYDQRAPGWAAELTPSARGELEITDLNRRYLAAGELRIERLPAGVTWLDAGTPDDLLAAGDFVRTLQARQGRQIACLEELALDLGRITPQQYRERLATLPASPCRDYLARRLEG